MTPLEDAGWRRDMEGEWKEVISRNRPELCKTIDTEGDFIDHLEGLKVFNNRTCQSFKSKTGRYGQVSAILTAMCKRPFDDFIKFCQALERSNQGHIIATYLRLNPQAAVAMPTDPPVVMPTSSTQADARPGGDEGQPDHPLRRVWRDLIRDNYPALIGEIDPDHGLFTHLVGKKVIMEWMQDTFMVKTGRSNRASAILDHLILKRPFEDFLKFCEALIETNQTHIVDKYFNRSRPGADHSDVCAVDIRPHIIDSKEDISELLLKHKTLSNLDWKATFVETRNDLVNIIDASNDFINLLLGFGVFNAISFEACQEKDDPFQRAEFILDYMRRRPDDDFLRFCVALAKSNQDHVIVCLLDHRIERPPSDSHSPQLQPGTSGGGRRGGGEGEAGTSKRICQPVDDNHEPMELMEVVERREQQDTPLAVYQGPAMAHNAAMPPVQQPIDRTPMICHPQDDEAGSTVAPGSIGSAPTVAREAAICGDLNESTCRMIEDDDRGPAEIENVKVLACRRDFYEMVHGRAYPMCRRLRGKCVIINNQNVAGMSTRRGTERDGWLLRQLFHQLHFQVEELDNIRAADIKQRMANLSKDETLRNDQCLVLFVLSHGQMVQTPAGLVDCIYGSDGEPVTVNEILQPLTDANCPQLRKKPKLVFFQACRGDYYQEQTQTDAPPVFRDFLIGYPTQRDYRSFRNTILGSWYINAIVQVFSQRTCDTSLSELMNMVTGKVAAWSTNTDNAENHQKGQTATYTSHLTKSLYFFPGIVVENDNR